VYRRENRGERPESGCAQTEEATDDGTDVQQGEKKYPFQGKNSCYTGGVEKNRKGNCKRPPKKKNNRTKNPPKQQPKLPPTAPNQKRHSQNSQKRHETSRVVLSVSARKKGVGQKGENGRKKTTVKRIFLEELEAYDRDTRGYKRAIVREGV